jgi:hypothetical protein
MERAKRQIVFEVSAYEKEFDIAQPASRAIKGVNVLEVNSFSEVAGS